MGREAPKTGEEGAPSAPAPAELDLKAGASARREDGGSPPPPPQPPGAAAGDRFGGSVSLSDSGDTALVGAYRDSVNQVGAYSQGALGWVTRLEEEQQPAKEPTPAYFF